MFTRPGKVPTRELRRRAHVEHRHHRGTGEEVIDGQYRLACGTEQAGDQTVVGRAAGD